MIEEVVARTAGIALLMIFLGFILTKVTSVPLFVVMALGVGMAIAEFVIELRRERAGG